MIAACKSRRRSRFHRNPPTPDPTMGLFKETVGATATLKKMRAARERRWRWRVKAECVITAAQRKVEGKTKSSEGVNGWMSGDWRVQSKKTQGERNCKPAWFTAAMVGS